MNDKENDDFSFTPLALETPPSSDDDSFVELASIDSKNSVDSVPIVDAFQHVSIEGEDMLSCQRCHFLNASNIVFCEMCGYFLKPFNSFYYLDMDEQIARNLQNKEEQEALYQLQLKEKEREEMHNQPLYVRAQTLATDIHTSLESMKRIGSVCHLQLDGYPEPAMVTLAMKFIEFHDSNVVVDSIGYHYTSEHVIDPFDFGPSAQIFVAPSASVAHDEKWCWMVAVAKTSSVIPFSDEGGQSLLHTFTNPEQSLLPLMCFPARCSSNMSSTVSEVSKST